MKRSFLFVAALVCTNVLIAAAPRVFAQTPDKPTTAPAKISPEKETSIRELMALTENDKLARSAMAQLITQLKGNYTTVSATYWESLSAKIDTYVKRFTDMMVPIYDKHYTQEEINDMITFYKSPLGKKITQELPAIQSESGATGSAWGQSVSQEIMTSLQAEEAKNKPVVKPFDTRPFKGNGKPVTTQSGLKYEDMTIGTGAVAVKGKTCLMHYTGTLTNGTKFDSSRDRNEPLPFTLGAGQVIKGWDEGVAGMKVGGRRRLVIPASLGYGARGAGNGAIPPNATLIFDVELMGVQ